MNVLFLSFYFEPDLCAGSFRNTPLFMELRKLLNIDDSIDVITTQPNRYDSYSINAKNIERLDNKTTIHRIEIPKHGSGITGQIKSFKKFYFEVLKLTNSKDYDLVYASSSRLFTAFLGAKIARRNKAKLYLDIRDIFRETITDLFKNRILKFGLNTCLKPIENYTFNYASHINLVSEGFKSYFERYDSNFSYFTNGIDEVFLKNRNVPVEFKPKGKKIIIYAGNIGSGQGLDKVIPKIAKVFEDKYVFQIIGDGGTKSKLEEEIKKYSVSNVDLIPPVSRNELIEYYQKADFLFLHLNKYKAFERVLPSKLFEYGTFDKPIIAGVGGYAKLFLKEHMENIILFEPTNVKELEFKLNNYVYVNKERKSFKEKFSREGINKLMAESIIKLINE